MPLAALTGPIGSLFRVQRYQAPLGGLLGGRSATPEVYAGHDVSGQPRDDAGQWVEADGVKWTHAPRAKDRGDELVEVDTGKMDAAWKRDGGYYLPEGGSRDKVKSANARKFLADPANIVHAPEVWLDDHGTLGFVDGRHRAAAARDLGKRSLVLSVPPEGADRLRKAMGVADRPSAAKPYHAHLGGVLGGRSATQAVQTYDAGRWVTIGGKKGEDGKGKGGSRVFIKDGRIVKGHPSLTGKKIDALDRPAEDAPKKERDQPATKRQEAADRAAQSRKDNRAAAEYDRARWRKKARESGHDPRHLDELAGQVKAHHDAFAAERKELLKFAREHSKANGFADLRQLNVLASKGKHDATMIRGFDLTAEETARRFPALFLEETGEHGNHADQLFDMLTGGDPEPMAHDDAYRHALDVLDEDKHRRGGGRDTGSDADEPIPFRADVRRG